MMMIVFFGTGEHDCTDGSDEDAQMCSKDVF